MFARPWCFIAAQLERCLTLGLGQVDGPPGLLDFVPWPGTKRQHVKGERVTRRGVGVPYS
jgi:hypothetical protein